MLEATWEQDNIPTLLLFSLSLSFFNEWKQIYSWVNVIKVCIGTS